MGAQIKTLRSPARIEKRPRGSAFTKLIKSQRATSCDRSEALTLKTRAVFSHGTFVTTRRNDVSAYRFVLNHPLQPGLPDRACVCVCVCVYLILCQQQFHSLVISGLRYPEALNTGAPQPLLHSYRAPSNNCFHCQLISRLFPQIVDYSFHHVGSSNIRRYWKKFKKCHSHNCRKTQVTSQNCLFCLTHDP